MSGIRFGVWALVHGSRAALQDPEEPYDASWARNRALILEAERLGYDCTLIAQHTINPHDADLDELEAWTAAAALAALTSRMEIITAIKPLLYHPAVLAKMALGIEAISEGRFAINLVNAWNRPEMEGAGIPFPEHDDRYEYGTEWLTVVEQLLRGDRVSHHGQHLQIPNYRLRPTSQFRARPRIYVGGESEPARQLVAQRGDVWFINGQDLSTVSGLIADVASRPRHGAPPLQFGLSTFVIARPTAAAAEANLQHLFELSAKDAAIKAQKAANTDPKSVMAAVLARTPRVGSNGGTGAGLVGDYDTVAERVVAFHRAGIETFMLQYQPFEREMARFAQEIMPRVERLLARAG